jgi:N-acetylneuraminic acid mutarotase
MKYSHLAVAASRQSAADFFNPKRRRSAETPLRTHSLSAVFAAALLTAAPLAHGGSDEWQRRAPANLLSGRSSASAVWTGSEMIVFGGEGMGRSFDDGARYGLANDSWRPLPRAGAPSSRTGHTAVWTGEEMIVWGGFGGLWGNNTNRNDGARYNPLSNKWRPVADDNAPPARFDHTAVWTGTEMIVWGGFTDGRSRYAGGHADAHVQSGGRYNPFTDSWQPTTFRGAPAKRSWHTAVWTGKEMIIWGGGNETKGFNDGGRYDPATDSWKPISTEGAPSPRVHHVAVWSDTAVTSNCGTGEMIVWGGAAREGDAQSEYFQDGARYNPDTDTWRPITTQGAPKPRILTKAVWTGQELLLWGGVNDADAAGVNDAGRYVGSGGRYNPATDRWTPILKGAGPSPRLTSGVWTGEGLLTFGGWNGSHLKDTYYFSPRQRIDP